MKPDPAGLQSVLQALGAPADQALYIGDRPEVDAKTAQAAGVAAAIVGPHAGCTSSEWLSVSHFNELTLYLEASCVNHCNNTTA
jgi:FMN phosphatase YigB (HAD superfamily)